MRLIRSFVLLVAATLAACGSVKPALPDAEPGDDAGATDAPDVVNVDGGVDARIDAGIDAPPPPPGQELTTGGGRMSGVNYTLDVQLGHPVGQRAVQGAASRLEANTPIKP
ncbi:MAG TPA: hypothetical protein VM261_16860 [Kofleriaceae bacterium]|nr:hypothetical protein [Kofleriaceae bacterium]